MMAEIQVVQHTQNFFDGYPEYVCTVWMFPHPSPPHFAVRPSGYQVHQANISLGDFPVLTQSSVLSWNLCGGKFWSIFNSEIPHSHSLIKLIHFICAVFKLITILSFFSIFLSISIKRNQGLKTISMYLALWLLDNMKRL